MRGVLILKYRILIHAVLLVIAVHAQDKSKMIFGFEWRTDYQCRIEYNVKYLNGVKSFSLKGTSYNYEGYLETNLRGRPVLNHLSGVRYSNTVTGFTLKPGWIFHYKLRNHFYYSHTFCAVVSRNEFHLNVHDSNNPVAFRKIDFAVGTEYEFLVGVRFLDSFILSAAVQTGTKQVSEQIYDGSNLYVFAYKDYTPAQGYSKGIMYLNATFGLSFIF